MPPMLRGSLTLGVERTVTVQFISKDGAVNLTAVGLDILPRVGETVDLGDGALFLVEHVRWSFTGGTGMFAGTAYARILLAPTADPYGADLR